MLKWYSAKKLQLPKPKLTWMTVDDKKEAKMLKTLVYSITFSIIMTVMWEINVYCNISIFCFESFAVHTSTHYVFTYNYRTETIIDHLLNWFNKWFVVFFLKHISRRISRLELSILIFCGTDFFVDNEESWHGVPW